MSFFENIYSDIEIDGTVYSGSAKIMGIKLQVITGGELREFYIGVMYTTTNESLWGRFVAKNKILLYRTLDGVGYGWTSI